MDKPTSTMQFMHHAAYTDNNNKSHHSSSSSITKNYPSNRRWMILALSCIVMHGLYYTLTMSASVYHHLREAFAVEDFEAKYQLSFAVVHLPGLVLPLLAGKILDKIGGKQCILLFSITCLVGKVISTTGVQHAEWSVLLLGRFIYGLGFESLFTSNQAYLSLWFQGQELGFALGMASAMGYIGLLLSHIISPIVANKVNTAFAFWIGSIVMGTSVIAAIIMYILDQSTSTTTSQQQRGFTMNNNGPSIKSLPTKTKENNHDIVLINDMEQSSTVEKNNASKNDSDVIEYINTNNQQQPQHNKNIQKHHQHMFASIKTTKLPKFGIPYWILCLAAVPIYMSGYGSIMVTSGVLLERNFFRDPPEYCKVVHEHKCTSGYLAPKHGNFLSPESALYSECLGLNGYAPVLPTSLKNVVKDDSDSSSSWLHSTSYTFGTLTKYDIDCADPFWSEGCTRDYCKQRESATETAGIYMSLPYVVTLLTTFWFGRYGVDQAGLRGEMMTFGPALSMMAHGMLASTLYNGSSPLLPLLLLGFGYSMSVSALWPSVALVLPSFKIIGTAYGVMTCLQNGGLTILPLIFALLHHQGGEKYLPNVEIFLAGCAGFAFLVGLYLLYYDGRYGDNILKERRSSGKQVGIFQDEKNELDDDDLC